MTAHINTTPSIQTLYLIPLPVKKPKELYSVPLNYLMMMICCTTQQQQQQQHQCPCHCHLEQPEPSFPSAQRFQGNALWCAFQCHCHCQWHLKLHFVSPKCLIGDKGDLLFIPKVLLQYFFAVFVRFWSSRASHLCVCSSTVLIANNLAFVCFFMSLYWTLQCLQGRVAKDIPSLKPASHCAAAVPTGTRTRLPWISVHWPFRRNGTLVESSLTVSIKSWSRRLAPCFFTCADFAIATGCIVDNCERNAGWTLANIA